MRTDTISWTEVRNTFFIITIVVGGVMAFNRLDNSQQLIIQKLETANRDITKMSQKIDDKDKQDNEQDKEIARHDEQLKELQGRGLLSKPYYPNSNGTSMNSSKTIKEITREISPIIIAAGPVSGTSAQPSEPTPAPTSVQTQPPSDPKTTPVIDILPSTGISLIDGLL